MKKKFSLLTLILCCISCGPAFEEGNTVSNESRDYFINEFEYKGHEYIQFSAKFDPRSFNGVVHNPSCKFCKDE